MEAKKGGKIKLIKNICYGTAYGIIEVEKGKEFLVKDRLFTGDGIITEEKIHLNGNIGEHDYNIEIWDNEYEIVNS